MELLPPLRLPHHLHHLSSGRGELVVDVEGGIGEVGAGLGVAASHEAGRELLPGAVLLPVPDANDEGGVGHRPLPAQEMAGGHILQRDSDARLGLNGSDARLRHGLLVGDATLPHLLSGQEDALGGGGGRGVEHQVPLHPPLPRLVTFQLHLQQPLLQPLHLLCIGLGVDHLLLKFEEVSLNNHLLDDG